MLMFFFCLFLYLCVYVMCVYLCLCGLRFHAVIKQHSYLQQKYSHKNSQFRAKINIQMNEIRRKLFFLSFFFIVAQTQRNSTFINQNKRSNHWNSLNSCRFSCCHRHIGNHNQFKCNTLILPTHRTYYRSLRVKWGEAKFIITQRLIIYNICYSLNSNIQNAIEM